MWTFVKSEKLKFNLLKQKLNFKQFYKSKFWIKYPLQNINLSGPYHGLKPCQKCPKLSLEKKWDQKPCTGPLNILTFCRAWTLVAQGNKQQKSEIYNYTTNSYTMKSKHFWSSNWIFIFLMGFYKYSFYSKQKSCKMIC